MPRNANAAPGKHESVIAGAGAKIQKHCCLPGAVSPCDATPLPLELTGPLCRSNSFFIIRRDAVESGHRPHRSRFHLLRGERKTVADRPR